MTKFKKGTKPHNFKDITGETFGEWTVVKLHGKCEKSKKLKWLCVHEDGTKGIKKRDSLVRHKNNKGKIHESHWDRGKAKAEGRTRYFNGKSCPKGHIAERMVSSGRCVQCMKEYKLEPRNVKRELARLKKDREKNREKYLEKENRFRNRPKNKIDASVRVRMTGCLRNKYKSKNFYKIFGYSVEDLKLHIERQFSKGMSWDNHSREGWHIDHIRPLSQFSYSSFEDDEFKICWAMSNLRPLWAKDNLKKSSTRTHLI